MEAVSSAHLAPTLTTGILAGLEAVLNEVLLLDAASSEKLSKLGGRWVQVSVTPLSPAQPQKLSPQFYLQANYPLRLAMDVAGEPDAIVAGSPVALLRYWQHAESGPALSLSGDSLLAENLAHISSELDIDWESKLEELIGNLPAHFISNRLLAAQQWLNYVQQNFFRDAEEYLHHESRAAPDQEEIKLWQEGITELASGVDNLERRLQKLESCQQATDSPPAKNSPDMSNNPGKKTHSNKKEF